MKSLSGIMSQKSQNQYLASCRARYPNRNRQGKSAMIDEVSDTLGWDRKHTIKALNGKVSDEKCAQKRGSKPIYTTEEIQVIIEISKRSEQPCGKRLKPTLPLWLDGYERHRGTLALGIREKIIKCSARYSRPLDPLAVL
jgi:hypothetical protein